MILRFLISVVPVVCHSKCGTDIPCRERGWANETKPDEPSVEGSTALDGLRAGDNGASVRTAGCTDRAGDSESGYGQTAERIKQRRGAAAVLLVVCTADREGETACCLCGGRGLHSGASSGEIPVVWVVCCGMGLADFDAGGCCNCRRNVGQQTKSASQITLLCKLPCIFLVGK